MKFANVKRFSILLAGLLGITVPTIAIATDDKTEFFSQSQPSKADGTQFAQKGEEFKAKPEDNIPYHVRCWQNGVLILDEINWRNPQLQSRFVAMKPMNGSEPGLYLVDFTNTFCEIKKR